MSVVVAIKHEGKIYMGSDSQVTKGGTRTTLSNPNNFKIWKIQGAENALMGHVGNLRDANIVRLMDGVIDDYDEFCDRVNFKFVVKYLVPEIISNLTRAKFLKVKDEHVDYLDSSFLFAYKDKLFLISSDCSVIEIDDCVAIGSGSQEAIGSLLSTEGDEPVTRIIKAIRASAANDIYVDYPIIISDTEECNFKVITEASISKYLPK